MFAVSTGFSFTLLQSYFKEDDPIAAMVLLIGIGALILGSIIVHFIRRSMNTAGAGKAGTTVTHRSFSGFALRRAARTYGLNRDQRRLLEFVFRAGGVADPERVMQNPTLLDKHFKLAYRIIERNTDTEEEAQQKLMNLFSLRNAIESSSANDNAPEAGQIAENTAAMLSTGRDSYPVRVLSSRSEIITVEVPHTALGTAVKFANGTKVTLSFFTKSSNGYTLESRVLGITDTPTGPGLKLAHSGKAKNLAKRHYRRKQTASPCIFYFVHVENTRKGRKKVPKLVVDTRRFTGSIMDISIGGCSIKTPAPVMVGAKLKIDIDNNDDLPITVLGQVLRTNRSGIAGTILHLKFLKVTRRAFNNINALVFGFDER